MALADDLHRYVLDATHAGDAPALMTSLDSLSRIVLANIKIPSEHSDHIIPFLKEIKENYGTPKACVHDMGNGICEAVKEVFPGVPDFICHFHFLRDIGKDSLTRHMENSETACDPIQSVQNYAL